MTSQETWWTETEDAILLAVLPDVGTTVTGITKRLPQLFDALPGRSSHAISARAYVLLSRRAKEREEESQRLGKWPPLGTRLFYTDPIAKADHGSPDRIQRPDIYWPSLSTAALAVRG